MSSEADGGGSDHGLLQAEGDGLDAVHDALRASNAFVSAKTMERLSERVSRTNEAESLRVRALEEEVLSLAESLVSFREERQRVSTERSKDTQRLEEALSAVVETEVSAAKGAEAAVVGAVVGMQGSVNRRLIDETKERDEGYHALQMEANMMTSSLRDTVHAHAAAASSSAQQMRAHYATQARQLEEAIAAAAASREAAHARLVRTIEQSLANAEDALGRQWRERRASEEGIASFMDRTLGRVVGE